MTQSTNCHERGSRVLIFIFRPLFSSIKYLSWKTSTMITSCTELHLRKKWFILPYFHWKACLSGPQQCTFMVRWTIEITIMLGINCRYSNHLSHYNWIFETIVQPYFTILIFMAELTIYLYLCTYIYRMAATYLRTFCLWRSLLYIFTQVLFRKSPTIIKFRYFLSSRSHIIANIRQWWYSRV